MKSSKWKMGSLAAIAAAAATFLSQAHADPIIFLTAAPANVAYGGAVAVDVNIGGLTQAIGAYNFDFNFDGTRLTFGSFAADPDTKMGDGTHPAFDVSGGLSGFSVNFNVLAGFVLAADEPTLFALQGTGFRLGSVLLTALSNDGFAALTVSGASLSDYSGGSINNFAVRNDRVCVSANGVTPCTNVVPEPTTPLLVAAALGALALIRKTKQA